MAKNETRYVCHACGASSPKWLGKCSGCGAWNTMVEEKVAPKGALAPRRRAPASSGGAMPITEIPADSAMRIPTRIGELDRVLGGGAVLGGAVLVGGDPGVGKSTLLLQALASIARAGAKALYASGEESASQTAMRARRLGIDTPSLFFLATNDLAEIDNAAREVKPAALVVDSVQTVRSETIESAAGTVSQLREVTARLVDLAQREGIATFLVGHVTKDGALAGPKVLEHLVDTVLSFEGERGHSFRALRTTKNRFGSATEVGLFEMSPDGMREVTQPSALFLAERPEGASGSVVAATSEGARSLLVEVQALVGPPGLGTPRRTATGLDGSRLAMLLAVLGRRSGLDVGACDVFVNAAGGLRVEEPAVDLAVALAVASSFRAKAFPSDAVVFGEVGLAGEVRGVSRAAARLAEAKAMGFRRAIAPASSIEGLSKSDRSGLEIVAIRSLDEALEQLG
ncbi:MAG: DNA repair protein RadA [Polyangiaceae bacterium]